MHLLPGPVVFSANVLAGVFDFERHRFVREALDPRDHLGFTYFVYDVELGQFDRFLNDERALLAADSAGEGCREAAESELLPRGSLVPFERLDGPAGERLSRACVSAPGGTDVVLRVEEGRRPLDEGGHFAKGSMAPKIEAGVAFGGASGGTALITHPQNVERALAGENRARLHLPPARRRRALPSPRLESPCQVHPRLRLCLLLRGRHRRHRDSGAGGRRVIVFFFYLTAICLVLTVCAALADLVGKVWQAEPERLEDTTPTEGTGSSAS